MGVKEQFESHYEGMTVVHWANPNRHPAVAVMTDGKTFSVVEMPDEEEDGGYDDWYEHCQEVSETHALEVYNRRVGELQETPNWEAQRQYDEEHGTDNGYDPGILAMEELWGIERD